jgi:hypothetical protein
MLVNLLQDPKPGRPLMTGRSHVGTACDKCGSTEKIWLQRRGRFAKPEDARWEACALCARRDRKRLYAESRKRYLASPKGRATTSRRRKRDRVRELAAQNAKRWRTRNPERDLYLQAKSRAKRLGLEFTITVEDIEIPERCPLLDIELSFGVGMVTHSSPSLDRKDSSKGYVKGNVWVISWRANVIKRDATLDELRLIVAGLERIR